MKNRGPARWRWRRGRSACARPGRRRSDVTVPRGGQLFRDPFADTERQVSDWPISRAGCARWEKRCFGRIRGRARFAVAGIEWMRIARAASRLGFPPKLGGGGGGPRAAGPDVVGGGAGRVHGRVLSHGRRAKGGAALAAHYTDCDRDRILGEAVRAAPGAVRWLKERGQFH